MRRFVSEQSFELDPPTVLFMSALVIACSGALLLITQGSRGRIPALSMWAAAMLAGAGGLVIATAGPSWLRTELSTGVFITASALSWTAGRLFRGRRPLPALIVAGPAAWAATLVFGHAAPQWAGLSCGAGAAYTLATAVEIARGRPESLPSRPAALVLLLLHAGIYAARAIAGLLGVVDLTVTLVEVLVIESVLHTNGMAFLLLALVKERVEQRATEQLHELARLDALTGIGNRRKFDEHLADELRRAARHGPGAPVGTPALLLLDVDFFKSYNDTLGHLQGDDCLRTVAHCIAERVHRPGDLATRYGGEEFAVVLSGTSREGALATAERIRAAVEAMRLPHPRTGVITISVGVAVLESLDGDLSKRLLDEADQALYAAKAAGRNAVMAAWLLPIVRRIVPTPPAYARPEAPPPTAVGQAAA